MSLRAHHLLQHAFDGFGISIDEAITLLNCDPDKLSETDVERFKIIRAAFDNLIDFGIAEEYQMAEEILDYEKSLDDEDEGSDEARFLIFKRFNKQYALVENKDVEYAMIVAAGLMNVPSTTTLTYMTQGDERVRPWHLQYEGFSAPKENFPAWLIPPIEHMCRCFLVEDSMINRVQASSHKSELSMPSWFNPTFKESVALGGRIFSEDHPYFQVAAIDYEKLRTISQKIKKSYLNSNG